MALQECGLNLSQNNKELRPHGSTEFPCAGYAHHYTDQPEDAIIWHWHEELEFIYIVSGQMEVRIPSRTFLLHAGDCVLINANMLHYAIAAPACDLRSLVFHPSLIEGREDSIFAAKYVRPLLSCPSFTGLLIRGSENPDIARWFNNAHNALAADIDGYEFVVRENLSRICLFLYHTIAPETEAGAGSMSQDNLRARRMLTFIHQHYAESLSVAEIAREADISERECLRCFRKTIQQSPIQYLLKYRIMQGASMLVRSPGMSISEIALQCGFDSQSNFAKVFRRFYDCTPKAYRKNHNIVE